MLMECNRTARAVYISQGAFITSVSTRFDLTDAAAPRHLSHPARTRPDLAFATSFGHDPGRGHWEAAKHVLRCLKGTKRWWLRLGGIQLPIERYTDVDWGSSRDDRRSTGARQDAVLLAGSLRRRPEWCTRSLKRNMSPFARLRRN